MGKKMRILALLLTALLTLGIFAGCKPQESQGNSSVSTQSEVVSDAGGEDVSDIAKDEGGGTEETNSATESKEGSSTVNRKLDINETGWPIVNKKITLTIMGQTSTVIGDPAKMSMFSYMEKKSNIAIKYQPIQENNIRERKTLALQSGDLPDAFAFTYNTFSDFELDKYSREGAFVELMDNLKKYAPNIYSELKNYPVQNALNVTKDGKIYTIPNKTTRGTTSGLDHWLCINQKWLKTLDLDIPKTSQDFLKVMRAFRDEDPNGNGQKDEVPFGLFNWGAHFILSFWGCRTGSGNMDVDNNYKAFYPLTSSNAKEACQYWYDFLNEEGLMDGTVVGKNASGSWAEWRTHIKSGKVGCFWWSQLTGDVFPPSLLKDYVAIEFPTANFKNKELNLPGSVNPYNNLTHRGKVIVTKACKNVPALLRYFDYFYTDEGIMVGNYGDPAKGLYKQLADGNYELTEKGRVANAGAQEAIGWYMALPDTQAMVKNRLNDTVIKGNEVYAKFSDAARETYANANKKNPKIRLTELMLTSDEIVKLRKYSTEFSSSAASGLMSFFVQSKKNDLANWTSKVNELEQKGLSGYVQIYQKVVDRNKQYLKPNV